jgi:hypothetical protein
MSRMWWCSICRTWNGSELPSCLNCERDRPRLPVRDDNVPVEHSDDVTLFMRARARLIALKEGDL